MDRVRDRLEKINNGALLAGEPLAAHTTFRTGGPADLFYAPRSAAALGEAVRIARGEGCPLFVLGGGANVLVGDGGFRGLVVATGAVDGVVETVAGDGAGERGGEPLIVAASGATPDELCEFARARGLAGLEFLAGMPGSIGGAVFMNARCYEREVADVLAWVELLGPDGAVRREPLDRAAWAYKRGPYQDGRSLILSAAFHVRAGEREAIGAEMLRLRADREAKGHYRFPCAGSVFKNDRSFGAPTGKIIDELGLRGLRLGGAMVAPYHGNIIVNSGGATSADIRALIEEVAQTVRRERGLALEREVLYVGEF